MRLIDAEKIRFDCNDDSDFPCARKHPCSKCHHYVVKASDIEKMQTIEAVPLSVIEKIHDAIDNADSDGFLINENGHMLAMTLTKEHVNDIIDKAVKEIERDA